MKSPNRPCALSNASTLRRNSSSPAQLRFRNASRSRGAIFSASVKMAISRSDSPFMAIAFPHMLHTRLGRSPMPRWASWNPVHAHTSEIWQQKSQGNIKINTPWNRGKRNALGLSLVRKEEEPFNPSADQEFTPLVNSVASWQRAGSRNEDPLSKMILAFRGGILACGCRVRIFEQATQESERNSI